jgi:hypothetical protein
MNELDEYYNKNKNTCKLNELIKKNTPVKELVAFMKINKIKLDSYIKTGMNVYSPLFHILSMYPYDRYNKLFHKIISSVDINTPTDKLDDCDFIPNILIICNEEYESYYIHKLSELTHDDIKYAYDHGLYNKICALKLIPKMNISVFDVIDNLINKLKMICITANELVMIEEQLTNYIKCFKILISNNLINYDERREIIIKKKIYNENILQLCADWYLWKIAELFITKKNNDNIKLVHHRLMDTTQTAYFRQLFNDYNYYHSYKLFYGKEPDNI